MLPTRQGKKIASYVLSALSETKNSNPDGLTAMKLSEVLQTQFRCPEKYQRHLASSLAGGVAFGAIEKKGHRYYLGQVMPQFREHRRRRGRRGRRGKRRSRSRGRRRRHRSRRGSSLTAVGQT